MKEDTKKKKENMCAEFKRHVYEYTLMLWDGLGFFGTDHMKLGRCKGEPVDFLTFLRSPRTLAFSLAFLILMIYIIFTEFEKLGTEKA